MPATRLGLLLAVALLSGTVDAVSAREAQQQSTHTDHDRERDQPLVTDRPDFTESAASVEPRRVQLELGYTREKTADEEVDSLGEVLLRIGLTEAIELRVAPNSYKRQNSRLGTDTNGQEDPSIGIKWETGQGSETPSLWRPATAILVATTLPISDSDVSAGRALPAAALALDWATSGPVGIASNVGLAAAEDNHGTYLEGVFSAALGLDLGGSWGGFVEYYTFIPEGSRRTVRQFVDAGLTYLVSTDFQLDIRVGSEISGDTDYFAGIGLAYRW